MLRSKPDQISQARREQEMLSTVDNSASEVSEANLTRDELWTADTVPKLPACCCQRKCSSRFVRNQKQFHRVKKYKQILCITNKNLISRFMVIHYHGENQNAQSTPHCQTLLKPFWQCQRAQCQVNAAQGCWRADIISKKMSIWCCFCMAAIKCICYFFQY